MLTSSSGADFDDPDYGVKEEDKSTHKVFSEPKILSELTADHVLAGGERATSPFPCEWLR